MSNWQQQVKDNKHFCVLPFTHMHLSTDNAAKLCCVADWRESLFEDLTDKTFEEIWNSPAYQKIRQDMIDGKPIKACHMCYALDEKGGGSDRWAHNNYFKEPTHDWDISVETGNTTEKPLWLDLRPGRFCNLGCRMCFVAVSSTFADEHKKHPELEEVTGESWFELQEWINNPTMYESLQALIPHIKTIKLAGGEPLFMPGVIKFLKWCVDSGNTHLHLDITTNGTRGKGKVINWLEKFDSVDIQYSIDGIGYTNDYIRHPSEWNTIETNYHMYRNISSVSTVNILSTVQAYNVFDLPNIIDFWKEHEEHSNNILVFNHVNWPEDMSIDIIPHDDRMKIADQIEQRVETLPEYRKTQCRMDATVFRLRSKFYNLDERRLNWAKRTVKYDQIRNQDIGLVHPKLAEYRDQWLKIKI